MLRNLKALTGYKLHATDGELGAVEDFYFDDETWVVRYMVARAGGWLSGREVLISRTAMKTPGWATGSFPVELTLEQVRNSPDIDTKKTVTRRHEQELHKHYAWPLYWGEAYYGGSISGSPLFAPPRPDPVLEHKKPLPPEEAHLQGVGAVTGYALHAADGKIGHVADFIVNDADWGIRYLVADTGTWLPGRKVLVSPHWIKKVSWETSEVFVDLTREAIEKSPQYDPSAPVSADYESDLYDHYGRPKLAGTREHAAPGRR